MTLANVLSLYLNLNLLIIIGFGGLWIFSKSLNLFKISFSSVFELRLHYTVLAVLLVLSALHPMLPKNDVFRPAAKVWSAESLQSFGKAEGGSASGYLSLPTPMGTSTVKADSVSSLWMALGISLLMIGGVLIFKDLRSLFRIQKNSFLVRKIGRVHVYVSETVLVPFSYWLPGQANIVVPMSLMNGGEDFKIAMAHEIQHHRHGDTRWVYVLWLLRWVCWINPVIHLWSRSISEIQEFACDETLVDQNKVESQAYARCLVEVAKNAIDQKPAPVCATGLTFLIGRNLLNRRIEKMLSISKTKMPRSIGFAVGALLVGLMGATAYASKGLVQDRRVSMAQAEAMALRAGRERGFPVVVNDLVLKQLNRFIGTPEGREYMRNALARMENHKALVAAALVKYDLPVELMAIPLIESGYENLAARPNSKSQATGVWQFIPSTARKYGLRVDASRDERMNLELSTDAALRYLLANNLRFKDWGLSALAYNIGENAVQRAMNELGTRDVWALIRAGYDGDGDYVSKVIAAVIIMRNPESVE